MEIELTQNFLSTLQTKTPISIFSVQLMTSDYQEIGEIFEMSVDVVGEDVYIVEISLESPKDFLNPEGGSNLDSDVVLRFLYKTEGDVFWRTAFDVPSQYQGNNIVYSFCKNIIFLDLRTVGVKAVLTTNPIIPVYQHHHKMESFEVLQPTNKNTSSSLDVFSSILEKSKNNNIFLKIGDTIEPGDYYLINENIYKSNVNNVFNGSLYGLDLVYDRTEKSLEQSPEYTKLFINNCTQEVYSFNDGEFILATFGVKYKVFEDFHTKPAKDIFILLCPENKIKG